MGAFRLRQPNSLDNMLLSSCVLITAFLAGSSSAGLLQNAVKALECPQNLVVSNRINDKNFMQQQIDCIIGPDSGCDEIGKKAKNIGPLILRGHCPRPMCDACTKRAVQMVVAKMQNEYKQEWFLIQQKLSDRTLKTDYRFIYILIFIYLFLSNEILYFV